MAKKIDLKAKAKRQKVIAAVLGVALLGVLAFQVPRTLKMLHGSSAAASPPSGGGDTSPPAPAAKPTVAVISVNGVPESVAVGAQFPASNPTFRLVSLTKKTAKIGIAGGSLQGGSQTVTLKKNVPLTLMNT